MPEIAPNEGQTVITSDGHELGKVSEVTATSFKIDVPFAHDYWLANTTVEVEQGGTLRLNIARIAVDAVKMPAPQP